MWIAAGTSTTCLPWDSSVSGTGGIPDNSAFGDLRMYVIFQFLPMILIPAVCILFRSRFTRQSDLYAVLGFYVLAKVAKHFDAALLGLTGSISGHSLKHLFAAMGAYWVARMLTKRKRTPDF